MGTVGTSIQVRTMKQMIKVYPLPHQRGHHGVGLREPRMRLKRRKLMGPVVKAKTTPRHLREQAYGQVEGNEDLRRGTGRTLVSPKSQRRSKARRLRNVLAAPERGKQERLQKLMNSTGSHQSLGRELHGLGLNEPLDSVQRNNQIRKIRR